MVLTKKLNLFSLVLSSIAEVSAGLGRVEKYMSKKVEQKNACYIFEKVTCTLCTLHSMHVTFVNLIHVHNFCEPNCTMHMHVNFFPSVNKSRVHVLGHKGTLRNTPKLPEFWHQRKFLFRNYGRLKLKFLCEQLYL